MVYIWTLPFLLGHSCLEVSTFCINFYFDYDMCAVPIADVLSLVVFINPNIYLCLMQPDTVSRACVCYGGYRHEDRKGKGPCSGYHVGAELTHYTCRLFCSKNPYGRASGVVVTVVVSVCLYLCQYIPPIEGSD